VRHFRAVTCRWLPDGCLSDAEAVNRPRKLRKKREESAEGLEINEAWYRKSEASGGVVATCRLQITSRANAIDGVLEGQPNLDECRKDLLRRGREREAAIGRIYI